MNSFFLQRIMTVIFLLIYKIVSHYMVKVQQITLRKNCQNSKSFPSFQEFWHTSFQKTTNKTIPYWSLMLKGGLWFYSFLEKIRRADPSTCFVVHWRDIWTSQDPNFNKGFFFSVASFLCLKKILSPLIRRSKNGQKLGLYEDKKEQTFMTFWRLETSHFVLE